MFRVSLERRSYAPVKLWLGIVCSVLFLILVFHNVRWMELSSVLQTVNWAILLLAALVYALSLVVRGLCWRALLAHLGPVRSGEAISFANIGYMANNLLPLRAGELIRAALLAEKRFFSKSAVLGTIVLERLLDVLILGGLTVLLMLAIPVPAMVRRSILLTAMVGGLGMIAVWWAAGKSWANFSEERLPRWFCLRAVRLGVSIGRSFGSGLSAVRSVKQAGVAGFYSLLAWMLVCGSIYLMMLASQLRLPWYAALLVLVVVNLGSVIPSSPGSIGVVHFMAVVSLSPWAVDQEVAVGFSIILHAVSVLVTVVVGGACLWNEKIGMGRVNKAGLEAAR
jgi:glycosyltransferase 2 family protein